MRHRHGLFMATLTLLMSVAGPGAQTVQPQQLAGVEVVALLEQADKLSLAFHVEEARARVEEALALATKRDDRVGVAMSYRSMGVLNTRVAASAEAARWFEKSLAAFDALGNQEGIALSLDGLVVSAVALGNGAKAREYGVRALELLGKPHEDRLRAMVLTTAILGAVDPARSRAWNAEVLEIAGRVGNQRLRADALARQGSDQFSAGDYAAARASYEQAIAIYEAGGDVARSASTYLSLGRVFRAHGDYEGGLQRYQKAIDLLLGTPERYVLVEATNAKAIALGNLNRVDEALATYRTGLALAHESGNPLLIDFMEGNLAGGLLTAQHSQEAIPLLLAVLARKPSPYIASFRYEQLGLAYLNVGRPLEGLEPINESIRLRRDLKLSNELASSLQARANMLSALGRFQEALTDAREALTIVEQIRTTLIPTDFLKRGYGDRVSRAYASIVDLLSQLGLSGEALDITEQGRSRAFLDLLAARETGVSVATRGPTAATSPEALTNEAIAKPLDASGLVATARRLKSTILSYWVGDKSILIWVVPADGASFHVRMLMTREQLAARVARTTAAFREPAANAATRGDDGDVTALPLRGLGVLALARDDKSAWRDLYKTLIEPVRSHLPRTGRLTIVPHGPLFQLSFAALQNTAGRYLVEDYELSYAPSISVLDFTARRQAAIPNGPSTWAIVGNPSTLPSVGGRPLPPLPGAVDEIGSISKLAPKAGRVIRLEGARANESELARTIAASPVSVLHFATHGFVFDDPKQPPFLALNRRGTQPGEDGRLTLDEIYPLRLSTDLVVLSACRSGSGQVSSDGVIGLARGFFYAGSPSVLATFWDVVDEATARLMTSFYRDYVRTHAKGGSLRAAQLALLGDLRAGKIVVTAGGRKVTLPEHPLLWAAFFLSGEP